jgi:hypothetical protein
MSPDAKRHPQNPPLLFHPVASRLARLYPAAVVRPRTARALRLRETAPPPPLLPRPRRHQGGLFAATRPQQHGQQDPEPTAVNADVRCGRKPVRRRCRRSTPSRSASHYSVRPATLETPLHPLL